MGRLLSRIKEALAGLLPLHSNRKMEGLLAELNDTRTKAWMNGLYVDSLKDTVEDLKDTNVEYLAENQRLQEEVDEWRGQAASERESHQITNRRLKAFEEAHMGRVELPYLPPVDSHAPRETPWQIVKLRLMMPSFAHDLAISSAATPQTFDILACSYSRALAENVREAFYKEAMRSFEELRNRTIKPKE